MTPLSFTALLTINTSWSPRTIGDKANSTDVTISRFEVASVHSKFFICQSSQLAATAWLDHEVRFQVSSHMTARATLLFWGIKYCESSCGFAGTPVCGATYMPPRLAVQFRSPNLLRLSALGWKSRAGFSDNSADRSRSLCQIWRNLIGRPKSGKGIAAVWGQYGHAKG